MRPFGAWFGLGIATGIVAGNSVLPLAPGPAAGVAAVAVVAAIGNPGAWILVPPSLGLWRTAATESAFRRLVVTVPQRFEGMFEVIREEGSGVVVRAGERRLLLGAPPAAAQPGRRFRGMLRADPVRAIADPSAFRADRWARTRGIHGRARLVGDLTPAEDAPGAGAVFRRAAHRFRAGARSRLGAGHSDAGSLVTALLLGDRRGLGTDERRDFRRAGLAHVLALSGMHVGVLALGTGSLLRALHLRGWPVLGAVLLFLTVFSFVTGARSPILRAATTSGLAAIGVAIGRRLPPVHAVGLVAGILLLRDPSALTDVGFRLSFTAAGLLALAASRAAGGRRRGWRVVVAGTGEAIVLSAILTLGTLSEIAASFGVVSVLAPVTNLLAGPPAAAALGWGGLSLIAWPEPLGQAFGAAARTAAAALLAVARFASPVPGGDVAMPSLGIPLSVAAVLAAGHLAARRRPGRRAAGALAGSTVLALAGAAPVDRLTILDVGQGNAALLEGGRRAILVDAGPAPYEDREAVAARAVAHRGVRRFEAAVATHGHADHVGGFEPLLRTTGIGRLLAPSRGAPGPDAWTRVRAGARQRGAMVEHPVGPSRPTPLLGGRAQVFSPWPGGLAGAAEENELSLVTVWRPGVGPGAALLTGDLGTPGESALVAAAGSALAAPVLLAGHHGSRHSTGRDLLAAVRPRLIVVSCGAGNPHGHPHAEPLARGRRLGAGLLRTDRDGTVTVTATRRGFRVRWERGFPARRAALGEFSVSTR